MYNILELSAKTLDQLKVIAAEMGIQKIDGIEQEDLVYKILDQQAIDMASKLPLILLLRKREVLNLRKIKRSLYLKNRMN